MQLTKIQQQLETNKSFQHYHKIIGLSFDDFQILEIIGSSSKLIKDGNKDFQIFIQNNKIKSVLVDTNNPIIKKHRLEIIKAS